MTLVGDSIVDSVPMPAAIEQALAAFIAEHHVEREFVKRKRDRANPEALARRSARGPNMSEPENFLSRWSRRKQAVAEQEAKLEEGRAAEVRKADEPQPSTAEAPAVDLSKLPSLRDITAETDITAFLKPGVPNDLARAALRRAWASDPAIRDFVGLQENDWDFNKPGPAEGLGPLGPEHDVKKLLAQVFGDRPTEEPPAESGTMNKSRSRNRHRRHPSCRPTYQPPPQTAAVDQIGTSGR